MSDIENYQALANAIIADVAKDYLYILAGFGVNIIEGTVTPTKESCEKFFRSSWYRTLTKVDGEYLISQLRQRAKELKLIYTVAKEKGSADWYVCKVGEESKRLSPGYKKKSKAISKAAQMQGEPLELYKKIRKRDLHEDEND